MRDRARPSGEQGVELGEALFELHQFDASVDEQVLAELIAAVHLEHQPAEVAEAVLTGGEEQTTLTPELARRRERAPDGTRRSGLGGCIERGRAAEPHRRRL